tara:strand:+ start:2373 stop:2834 length:462 start_codon:yes stop_codon:yes gene_type:complete
MRKFTLYQASRFTKISRYKLEQAIEDGLLKCTEGKGNVKCFIQEEDLNAFLENHGEEYRRFTYPEETKSTFISDEINQFISKEIHDQIISEKDRVISLLEFQNQQLMPLSDQKSKEQMIKLNELKSIAQAAIDGIPSDKLQLINQLNDQLKNI